MENAALVILAPNKANITYSIKIWKEGLHKAIGQGYYRNVPSVKVLLYNAGKYLIALKSNHSSKLSWAKMFFDPPEAPNLSQFLIVDMYCSCTQSDVQQSILSTFLDVSGKFRVVIATVAFGLGLDCPDLRYVVCCGPPENVKAYLLESG